ncbi:MAG: outer membrane protein transport protein, partial [Kofleriaceae bacterium]|nr:outer membrane protein transport protein [Kofleriaceae bacterium]
MKKASLCAIVLLCGTSVVASANPLDMFGSGARGASMAGAQTAATNDASANFYNPALLATIDGTEIDIEYRYAVPRLRLNGKDLGVDVA